MTNCNSTLSTLKVCPKCEIEKTIDDFALDSSRKSGRDSYCKACRREYVQQNKQRMTNNARKWRQANRERSRQIQREYVSRNEDHVRFLRSQWRKRNREVWASYTRDWQKRNTLAVRAKQSRRRALQLAAPGSHTDADIQRQYQTQDGKCYYCGVRVGQDFHVDHVIPLSRGGSDGPENIVVACPRCNWAKYNKLPTEWGHVP